MKIYYKSFRQLSRLTVEVNIFLMKNDNQSIHQLRRNSERDIHPGTTICHKMQQVFALICLKIKNEFKNKKINCIYSNHFSSKSICNTSILVNFVGR